MEGVAAPSFTDDDDDDDDGGGGDDDGGAEMAEALASLGLQVAPRLRRKVRASYGTAGAEGLDAAAGRDESALSV